jgi:hypothetical protein
VRATSLAALLSLLSAATACTRFDESQGPGSLVVRATFTGNELPERAEVAVNTNVEFCGHKVFTEDLLVDNESRGIQNVVVRLNGVAAGKELPAEVVITNRNCAFEPHVAATVKGAVLKVKSADPIHHTTHPYYEGGIHFFNASLQRAGAEYPGKRIDRSGLIEVRCDVHNWMKAYIVVHSNPYIGVTGGDGRVEFTDVPAGTYPYVAWHEKLGVRQGRVTIESGKTAELKLEYPGTP